MKILISNDDGYQSEGIRALAEALNGHGDLTIVAPDRNRSGASNSLTLSAPLRVKQAADNVYFVNGTPTDCVHLGITGLFDFEHDMVVSGINHGANLGDDILYSGTVAAAIEGRFFGLPAIAFSLAGSSAENMDCAARVANMLVGRVLNKPLPPDTILNVNVPDRPFDDLEGFSATRLGHRHQAEPAVQDRDPRGREVYWIGPAGPGQDAGPGTDFHAIETGHVSITPLQVDLTNHGFVTDVQAWLDG